MTARARWCVRDGIAAALLAFVTALSGLPTDQAHAQGAWKPAKPVEFVTGGGAGGAQDQVVRLIQQIAQQGKLLPVNSQVITRLGGGGTVSIVYVNQHAGDGHYLVLVSPTFATNHITGAAPIGPADVTPVVNLFSEYLGYHVPADSPLKTGRDLVRRLTQNPQSLSIAIGSNLGNLNHMSLVKLMRSAGMSDADIRKLKTVAFKGSDAVPALLGGHIDLLILTAGTMAPHVEAGKVRTVALSSPQRLAGIFAGVPTWQEQGYAIALDAWRMMLGPKGMSAAQLDYWDGVFAQIAASSEWKKELDRNNWADDFKRSRQTRAYLEAEYAEMKSLLLALGLLKQ